MSVTNGEELEAAARLIAQLLLREVDETTRTALTQPGLSAALEEVGLDLSSLGEGADLDALAAEYLETFLQPKEGGPLVQSLWSGGSYEGDEAVAIRKLAEACGVDFDRDAARGAAHDHLGCILLLWATTREMAPEVAQRLETDHLTWALVPLGRIGQGEGFYASVARVASRLITAILEERATA